MKDNVTRRGFLKITSISAAVIFMMSFALWSSALDVPEGMITVVIATDPACVIEGRGGARDSVVQERVDLMVNASIVELTGMLDISEAYETIFPWGTIDSTTKILIKVNPRTPETSRGPMVKALKKGLTYMLDYTFPEENITVVGAEGDASDSTFVIDTTEIVTDSLGNPIDTIPGLDLKYNIKSPYVDCDFIINCPSAWAAPEIGCGVDMALKAMMDAVVGVDTATIEDMYPFFMDTTWPALGALNGNEIFWQKQVLFMMDVITYSTTGDTSNIQPGYKIYTTTNIVVSDYQGIKFLKDSADLSVELAVAGIKVCSLACAPYPWDLGVTNEGQMFLCPIGPPWITLTLTSPSEGQTYKIGDTLPIKWNYKGIIDSVNLFYSLNNGTDWTQIDSNVENSGSYNKWTAPDNPVEKCKIKIEDASDNTIFDTSGTFAIDVTPISYIPIKNKQHFYVTVPGVGIVFNRDIGVVNKIELFDLRGRQILSVPVKKGSVKINQKIDNGCYILQIHGGRGLISKRFIVTK